MQRLALLPAHERVHRRALGPPPIWNAPESQSQHQGVEAIADKLRRDQGKPLSDEQEELYGAAIAALGRSPLGRDPKLFGTVLDIAINHCERARAFDWPEGEARERVRRAQDGWESVNSAAHKLAIHFKNLDERTASTRLWAALNKAGMQMSAAHPSKSLHLVFADFLRTLASQRPKRAGGGYQIGPLRVGRFSQKLPSREVVLTLVLAHLFGRAARHDGNGTLKIGVEPITSGSAWEVAADFASAALGKRSVDPSASKKFLREHRGHLYYQAWP
jgi:hypothetical protein